MSGGVRPPRRMHPSLRIATTLPLAELWTAEGPIVARRAGWLSPEAVRRLLATGPVQFVLAHVGTPLRWAPLPECYVAWKGEVRPHLVDAARPYDVFAYDEGYVYLASLWETADPFAPPVVLLERHE